MKGDKEMDKIIKKVNEYAKLSKERELTEEEKKDRDKYRKLYMDKFRQTMRGHLDNIKIFFTNSQMQSSLIQKSCLGINTLINILK